MDTAVINVKVQSDLKAEAQAVANELGLTVSALVNGFLKHLVRSRAVTFSLKEEPSDYLVETLRESMADIKSGRVSPSFSNAGAAIRWLKNPSRKYARKI